MFLPEYDPAYDPVEHIRANGFQIIRHTLDRSWAITSTIRRQVLWDPKLPPHMELGVFSHEASHVEQLDQGGHHPRHEARADLHSALRCIDPAVWDRMAGVHHDYDALCIEFGITRGQFRAYVEHRKRMAKSRLRVEQYGSVTYIDPKMGVGQWAAKIEVA